MDHYFGNVLRQDNLPSSATISHSLLSPAIPNFCETECNTIMSAHETGASLKGQSPVSAATADSTGSSTFRDRKLNKQEMEKKRRDRINVCVEHFKEMLIHVDGQQNSKLEKADVLERMTEYVRELQTQNRELRQHYGAGYRAASSVALETFRRTSLPPTSSAEVRRWKDDLERHLSACLYNGMKTKINNNNNTKTGVCNNKDDNNKNNNNNNDLVVQKCIKPLVEDNCNRSSTFMQLSAQQMALMERLYQKYLTAFSSCEDSVVPSILMSQCEAMLRSGLGNGNCQADNSVINVVSPSQQLDCYDSAESVTWKELFHRSPVVVTPPTECSSLHSTATSINDSGIDSSLDASASALSSDSARRNDTSLKRRQPYGTSAAADDSTTTPKLPCRRMWQPFL